MIDIYETHRFIIQRAYINNSNEDHTVRDSLHKQIQQQCKTNPFMRITTRQQQNARIVFMATLIDAERLKKKGSA